METQRLKMDFASLQASNSSLRDKLKEEQNKLAEKTVHLQQCEDKVNKYDKLQLALMDTQQEVNFYKSKCTQLELSGRVEGAEELLEVKDSIIEKQKGFMEDLESKIRTLQVSEGTFKLQVEGLQRKLDLKITDIKDVSFKLKQREDLIEKLQKEVDEKTMQLERLHLVDGEDNQELNAGNFMNEELQRYRQRLDDQSRTLRSVENHSNKLTAQLDNKDQEILSLKSEILSLTTTATASQKTISTKDEEIQELKDKLEVSEEETRTLNQRNDDLGKRIGLLENELHLKVKELEKKDVPVAGPIRDSSIRYGAGDSAVFEALNAKVNAAEMKVNDLNSLLKFREDYIKKLEVSSKGLNERLASLESEKKLLVDGKSSLESESRSAKEQCAKMKSEYDSMKQSYDSVLAARDAALNEKATTKEAYKQTQESVASLTEKNNALEAKMKRFTNVFQEAKKELQIREKLVDKLTDQVKELRIDNEAKRSELFDLRSKMDKFVDDADALKFAERRLSDLEAQHKQEKSQAEVQMQQIQQAHDLLAAQNVQLSQRISELEVNQAIPVYPAAAEDDPAPPGTVSSSGVSDQVLKKVSDLTKHVEVLQVEVHAKTQVIDDLHKTIDRLQEENRKLEEGDQASMLTSLLDQYSKAKTNFDQMAVDFQALREKSLAERQELQGQVTSLESQLEEAQKGLSNSQTSDTLAAKPRRATRASKRRKTESEDAESDVVDVSCSQCEQLKEQLSTMEESLACMKSSQSDLQTELQVAQARVLEITQEVEEIRARHLSAQLDL